MKPKRKRKESDNSLSFVTALTVEQCVERLEKGPAHTLDYRLTVRTDGQRFVVEVWGETKPPSITASLVGYLSEKAEGSTRVSGTVLGSTLYENRWIPALMPLVGMMLLIGFMAANDAQDRMLVGVIALTLTAFARFWFYEGARIARLTPDLRRWVMDQLYEPPESTTP